MTWLANPGAERLRVAGGGSPRNDTAPSGWAAPAELAAVADLFAAFGMLPVGYYDLRTARSPIPVVLSAA